MLKTRLTIPQAFGFVFLVTAILWLFFGERARAQTIGGNATLAVTTTSTAIALPASTVNYPAVLLAPAPTSTTEIFYKFGTTSAVAATTSSPALPPGGLCFASQGPNGFIDAVTATGTATLHITQLTQCPQGYPSASNSGGGGGSYTPGAGISISGGVISLGDANLTYSGGALTTNTIALGGATIGGNALAVTGSVLFNTALGYASGGTGLSALGTGNYCLTTNSGATAMAWAACVVAGAGVTVSGRTVSLGDANLAYATGVMTLGAAGSVVGKLALDNATSGSITLQPTTGALGSSVISFPAVTGTATVLGNSATGSGNLVLANSPSLVTPALGVATGTSLALGAGGAVTSTGPGGALAANAFLGVGTGLSSSGGNLILGDGTLTYSSGALATTSLALGGATGGPMLATLDSVAKTSTYTSVSLKASDTSSTASINKVGLDIESTGAWTGTSAVNTGLVVNATGGTTNYAATFSGGYVGIGLTNPAYELDVNALITGWAARITSGSASVYLANSIGDGVTIDPGASASSATSALNVNRAGTYYFYVRGDGNVGIGTGSPSQLLTLASTGAMGWDNGSGTADTIISRHAAANFQHGAADAAAPVAQIVSAQSVVSGTSNTAGQNWTMNGSVSTGSGSSGDIIFQTGGNSASATIQNALSVALTIKGNTQQVNFADPFQVSTSTTGAGAQTFTNSPCSGLTTERWVSIKINGQSGTWYTPACQ